MSHDYTFISDLNNNNNMSMYPNAPMQQGPPMQGGPMQQGMPMQSAPMQQGMPMQSAPMQQGPDQFDMLRKYLAESDDDSDSDSDDDSDTESDSGSNDNNWLHFYGIATLIMLAVILYYVFKIRKELVGMYEEA